MFIKSLLQYNYLIYFKKNNYNAFVNYDVSRLKKKFLAVLNF